MSPELGQRILRSIAIAPTYLYQWNVGWLLGSRFLRLTHVGRRSGRRYQTVLEVVGEDPGRQEIMVVAGLGHSAQWYRNVRAGNAVAITIGRRYFHPVYRELGVREAASVVGAYEQRNRWAAPFVRRLLSSLVGWRYDGTERARQKLVAQLPVIAFRPGPQGNVRRAAVQYERLAEPTGTCLPILTSAPTTVSIRTNVVATERPAWDGFRALQRKDLPMLRLHERRRARSMPDGVAVRTALPDDRKALASLAGLDSAHVPHPPILLATVNNNLRAAISLADGTIISDPFYPTAELVELLHARAAELAS